MMSVASPIEAYAAGVRGWACAIPNMTVHVISCRRSPWNIFRSRKRRLHKPKTCSNFFG